MKKKTLIVLSLLFAAYSHASLDSIEIFGTFINDTGCRAYNVNCANVEFEDGSEANSCDLTLLVDGEEIAFLGKGGKLVETGNNLVVGRDRGLRIGFGGLPEWANVTAEFKILKTYVNPTTYPEASVSSFDIKVKNGYFGKTHTCKNMVFAPSDD